MANNDQSSVLQVSGLGHRCTNVWFLPNGAANPVSFGGPYVSNVIRSGAGTYVITWTGFSPRALLGADCYAFDAANPTDTDANVGGLPNIVPATKTVTMSVLVRRAIGSTVAKDVAANPASIVKLSFHWKTFSGVDVSGL